MEEIFGEILNFLDLKMTEPEPYGWFHLMWLGLSFLGGVLLCVFLPQGTEKQVRRVVLTTAVVVLLLEVYKQINYTFTWENGEIRSNYQWYSFPWQFCSTPMYVGLLAGLTHGRLHRCLCDYLGSYALFAGLCVMFYPATVFISTIGINIQTMVCHGSMISVAMYLLYTGYVKANGKMVLRALPVFLSAVAIAMVLNEIAYRTGLLKTHTFNMFFISPYCEPSLAVYASIQRAVSYPWCLIFYVAGFTAAVYLLLALLRPLVKLLCSKQPKVKHT